MDCDLGKTNDKKQSSNEHCQVSTNLDSFSMASIEKDNLIDLNKSKASSVGVFEPDEDADRSFSEVSLTIKTKTKFRKRMKLEHGDVLLDSLENSDESQIDNLVEEIGHATHFKMNAMSTLTLLGEGNSGEKVNSFETPSGQMRKKLLVLDLNGLLVDIVFPPPRDFQSDAHIAGRAVFKRPFCDDFLKFCFERFDVGIWSSRTSKNVERFIDFLMGDMKPKLLFCWDSSYCTKTRFTTPGHRYKPLVFKEMQKIWEKQDPNLPWEKGYYNETNTLLIDDSPYKALLNPPYTAIFPNSFKFDRNDNSLGIGGDLRVYLERLAAAENVKNFVEQNPIGQLAITEKSDDWSFYSQVIGACASAVE